MQKNSGKVRLGVSLVAAALLTLGGGALYAAQLNSTASVEILGDLTITEVNPMDFGVIVKPTDVNDTFTLSEVDSSVTGTGASNGYAGTAGGQRGEYSLSGQPSYAVDVTANVLNDFSDPGVNLTALRVGNAGTVTLDGTGNGQANVGGDVEVQTTATPGTYTADIEIIANYQ